jgi:hypothetical protein
MSKEQRADPELAATGHDPASFGLRSRKRQDVATRPFAGRIGGNQEFVVHGDSDDADEILKKQPDAVGILQCRQICLRKLMELLGASFDFQRFVEPEWIPCARHMAASGHRRMGYAISSNLQISQTDR